MSALDSLTNCISKIQEKNIFNREQCRRFGRNFLFTVGISIVIHRFISIVIGFFVFLAFVIRQIRHRFLSEMIDVVRHRPVVLPMFIICSIVSFFVTKFSMKTLVQFYDRSSTSKQFEFLRHQRARRSLFVFIWLFLLFLQIHVFLLPMTNEDKRFSSVRKRKCFNDQSVTNDFF